jgi:hypothetical protein
VEVGSGFGFARFVFQSTEQALPPGWMHLIGDMCLPSALLLDPMLFLRDLLVHSGVAPRRAEIAHRIEAIPRHFAEQVTHGSPQYPGEGRRAKSRGFRLPGRAFRVSVDGVGLPPRRMSLVSKMVLLSSIAEALLSRAQISRVLIGIPTGPGTHLDRSRPSRVVSRHKSLPSEGGACDLDSDASARRGAGLQIPSPPPDGPRASTPMSATTTDPGAFGAAARNQTIINSTSATLRARIVHRCASAAQPNGTM